MTMIVEQTVTATEFKAKCLEFMDKLERRQLDRVLITKRGRVVSMALPPPRDDAAAGDFDRIFGCMKGWVPPVPAGHDWEAPAFSDAQLQEFIDETERQIDEVASR